jgi:hypothetical protein
MITHNLTHNIIYVQCTVPVLQQVADRKLTNRESGFGIYTLNTYDMQYRLQPV